MSRILRITSLVLTLHHVGYAHDGGFVGLVVTNALCYVGLAILLAFLDWPKIFKRTMFLILPIVGTVVVVFRMQHLYSYMLFLPEDAGLAIPIWLWIVFLVGRLIPPNPEGRKGRLGRLTLKIRRVPPNHRLHLTPR
jgi:hypothetical protein